MSVQDASASSGPPRTMPTSGVAPRRDHLSHQAPPSHEAAVPQPPAVPLPDVFSHPAVIAYVANHPNRPLPKFGAYYMLQTLGEGEFGKVKLGLHYKYGEEAAVKLIRRETADNEGKMAKIAREIEILDILKHPNIVRLYDVFETDKFFGIILEYASGGELFDHILAHRYLRERDAAKLFSQLISGVWYMHQKNIVHRDLKLENLLLDRHRNLIITDFGFANHFNHNQNDLMETMCGSPCYAAPELVNNNGLYVGTTADIWSCGVILYAMLSGYLPFDDDPENPDGEDINKLYAYIACTPLTFPDYISDEARHLLGAMLTPDPGARADLATVMRHPWFAVHAREVMITFGLTVKELEQLAEVGPSRRLAYQRGAANGATAPQSPRRRQGNRAKRSEGSESHANGGELESFPRTASPLKETVGSPRKQRGADRAAGEKGKEREREQSRKERHTIQVEYEERRGARDGRQRERQVSTRGPPVTPLPVVHDGSEDVFVMESPTKGRPQKGGRSSGKSNSPSVKTVFSPLDSTAELPLLELSARKGSVRGSGKDVQASNIPDVHDPLSLPRQNGTQRSVANDEARAQLSPLIIASSAQHPSTSSAHPNMRDLGTQGSPSKPNKVMQWFRKGRRSINVSGGLSPNTAHQAAASSVEVASIPHTPVPPTQPSPSPFLVTPGTQEHRQRTTSAVSITSLFRRSAGVAGPSSGSRAAIRVHHGAVDHEMITAGRPTEVMQHMKDVLAGMGVDVQFEGDFKYRCIRPARHRDRRAEGVDTNGIGTRGSNGVFRGLLSRRQPSPSRPPALSDNDPSSRSSPLPSSTHVNTVYGDLLVDIGDEVRFSVELTRLDRLKDMYSLDVRRLKGNLKSYKFLYDSLRTRADLER